MQYEYLFATEKLAIGEKSRSRLSLNSSECAASRPVSGRGAAGGGGCASVDCCVCECPTLHSADLVPIPRMPVLHMAPSRRAGDKRTGDGGLRHFHTGHIGGGLMPSSSKNEEGVAHRRRKTELINYCTQTVPEEADVGKEKLRDIGEEKCRAAPRKENRRKFHSQACTCSSSQTCTCSLSSTRKQIPICVLNDLRKGSTLR